MQKNYLSDIATWGKGAGVKGIPSICSAHPMVIEASMRHALARDKYLLVEATCNQVNQDGGYTGMTPADFRAFVETIAAKAGFPREKLLLGGDHLGPNPWKQLPAAEAMKKARVMIDAYARAGFTKLHLDTSMGCAGEPVGLPDALTAERAASLAATAEAAVAGSSCVLPVYIIGTEVPIPGGAMEELNELEVTKPEAARRTIAVHRTAFEAAGVSKAFDRVVGAVVQPGVEFGNHNVIAYDSGKAAALSATLADLPGLVFEAHSTDYQTRDALRSLVLDGFAILKVGPGLTFALREAFYGLDRIAAFLFPTGRSATLLETIETVMVAEPKNWEKYYHGTADEQRLQRHFSYSDRVRYYFPNVTIRAAVEELFGLLADVEIPETLISQYLQGSYEAVRSGKIARNAEALALHSVDCVLEDYFEACRELCEDGMADAP
ncbi:MULTISPECIES: D-tagatose-bisphosphate aldolase, class II, non-catalytic subunit [unclassified Rhizobium]|uniref:D-tagatose-bisphosphate aldolase, class II, non-catalytic subunit n=1 Tax=unclassified Rhizobium TaxID=2613769 RepID=UPI001ADA9AAB|nr:MULTISPECIES: D-tagatose-bisphosphate aldolase, class II, non-catalytic subunit [unclassified Rhizobium]MBO9127287.1 D-tagatose-bisphosphate aldolase, class II, non-catalytic subunit [Rhizobium sp. 16-488-2b]MBO9177730.1 D-tagatose-bisphosphate aldolase, class II, non-catalytic subunit [Rhizobium sp. 16-488-2a]